MTQNEKLIANEIAKANGLNITKLGLRFDKVVIRLLKNIRIAIKNEVPKEKAVIITMTAPIKHPAKTENDIIGKIKDILVSGKQQRDTLLTIFQNEIQLRVIKSPSKQTINFIGLVHNRDIDSKYLLDITSKWLLEE
jgi:hypothetical protein